MAIGLATLRRDGFASVGASYDGGSLTTVPYVFDGDALTLNVKADYGQVQAELLDERGAPLPGFDRASCVPVREDSVDARLRWRGAGSLRVLEGRPARLRLHLVNARLYAYRSV